MKQKKVLFSNEIRMNRKFRKSLGKNKLKTSWRDPETIPGFDLKKSDYNNRGKRHFKSYETKLFRENDLLIYPDPLLLSSRNSQFFFAGRIWQFPVIKGKRFVVFYDCRFYSHRTNKTHRKTYWIFPYQKIRDMGFNVSDQTNIARISMIPFSIPKIRIHEQNPGMNLQMIFPRLFPPIIPTRGEFVRKEKKKKEVNQYHKDTITIVEFLDNLLKRGVINKSEHRHYYRKIGSKKFREFIFMMKNLEL